MSTRVFAPQMTWMPLDAPSGCRVKVYHRLDVALARWAGTPYESGQRFRQRGADCIGAVFGVIDELDGRDRAAYPNMPHDTSMHDRAGAVAAMRELARRYAPIHILSPEDDGSYLVEPGDLVVTGPMGGGPGHVELVGDKNQLWHCLPCVGFHCSGWSFFECQVLYAVYRIEDKWRWVDED